VHRWILKPKPSRRFVKVVAIRPTTPRRLSIFVAIRKKTATSQAPRTHHTATQAPPHPCATSPPRERPGPTSLPHRRHLTQAPRHHHLSAKGPPHCHARATSPRCHITATQASRAHLTAMQAPPHPRHEFLVKKGKPAAQGTQTPNLTPEPKSFYHWATTLFVTMSNI
jgi:hypothetical protein